MSCRNAYERPITSGIFNVFKAPNKLALRRKSPLPKARESECLATAALSRSLPSQLLPLFLPFFSPLAAALEPVMSPRPPRVAAPPHLLRSRPRAWLAAWYKPLIQQAFRLLAAAHLISGA